MTAPVSIVLPSLDTTDLLAANLPALFAEVDRRAVGDEVIVVDDTGRDALSAWMAEHFPTVLVEARAENGGFAQALEGGIRRARHDYVLLAKVEAGLVLRGSEVKSLRQNGVTIREGYGKVEGGELWLYGIHIPPLKQASWTNHDPDRRRKCLVHRREIKKIEEELRADGVTLVVLAMYFKGVRAKVELALARGRRKADRRQREREKEDRKRMRDAM